MKFIILPALGLVLGLNTVLSATPSLESGWTNPPVEARLRAYWWWLNGNVTSNAITRDLVEMQAKGFGGALICDAGGAEQGGHARVKPGPTFLTPEWRALYRHTLAEAARLGLEMSVNIQSGWNLGGPGVTQDDANKKLIWSEAIFTAPTNGPLVLPRPAVIRDNYYRDVVVIAFPNRPPAGAKRAELTDWRAKAMLDRLAFEGRNSWFLANSAPVTTRLIQDQPGTPGEAAALASEVMDLTAKLAPDGTLDWTPPDGSWTVLRFGATIGDHAYVSTSSDGWKGYALDPLDAGAFRRYWDSVVEVLIADAGSHAGTTLKYLHTDSWEVDAFNWTPTQIDEFKKRRSYDPLPYFPALAGYIVNDRKLSNRFLHDYRRTLGDLAMDNHFRLFRQWANARKLQIHPESGGPHFTPVDAQQALANNDVPMAEFWAESRSHRVDDVTRLFVKQPASAAHTAGHKFVAAEGFTTVGPQWQERIWDNLKPSFDVAICEGLNRLVWHAFVCSPEEEGLPGIQYFAGTHFNPATTWWEKSTPFLAYLNRSQWMMQQGLFVADVVQYYGDHVPNFTQLKSSNTAKVLPGYDYDVIAAEQLLTRMQVKNGRPTLPDGMSYRLLVLPEHHAISVPVLEKVRDLVQAGATVIGPRPQEALSLQGYPECDGRIEQLADQLWGETGTGAVGEKRVGKGRVIWGRTAREVLLADGIAPDCEFLTPPAGARLDYIHRRTDDADIYFVANRNNTALSIRAAFRVTGQAPELWNAVTGERRFARAYEQANGRTVVPLEFTPCGSWFVVFRTEAAKHPPVAKNNAVQFQPVQSLDGSWSVTFDQKLGGPGAVTFETLTDWTQHSEPGVKFYSGTAVYTKTFAVPPSALRTPRSALFLDLGDVRELAEVKVNGRSCGIVWAPPFRVNITDAVQPGTNTLQVEVVNFWPNRIIGERTLPPEQRFTRTNIRTLTEKTPLLRSGLFGPVQLGEVAAE